jgi:uncharacterized repeat protein (TIGR03803 family)
MQIGHARCNRVLARMLMLGTCALLAATLVPRGAAAQEQEKVLYSFCESDCFGGANPRAGLIMDSSGNLYGTTEGGGHGVYAEAGTVFELIPNTAKTAWTEKVLYSFCSEADCADGEVPYASLIRDAAGNLYGTTSGGGAYSGGTVFELTPPAKGKTAWAQKVLYSFCAGGSLCTDGQLPEADLIMDVSGNLYGTTESGGAHQAGILCEILGGNGGCGTVFELTPPAKGKTAWTHKVLYSFCAQGSLCTDGATPVAGLIRDAGKLYGTTDRGGTRAMGTVFELTPPAKGKTAWTEKVLYSFCARSGCTDGYFPEAGLIMDAAGNLYGTTEDGGAHELWGTVFELIPNAAKTAWTQRVLHSFGAYAEDGLTPFAGLIMDKSGNLYGTTYAGGAAVSNPYGTVFELKP